MKCINDCGMELTGRQKTFCSDKCRKQHKRRDKTHEDGRGCVKLGQGVVNNPDKPKSDTTRTVISNFGQSDCQCRHCQINRKHGSKHIINHGPYKTHDKLATNELNRVSLPGDADYTSRTSPADRIPESLDSLTAAPVDSI